jgi:hypothetical protein
METLNNYQERKKNPTFHPKPRVVKRGKKKEQVKVAHWNPTWVVKKKRNKIGLKPCYSTVKTCEGH